MSVGFYIYIFFSLLNFFPLSDFSFFLFQFLVFFLQLISFLDPSKKIFFLFFILFTGKFLWSVGLAVAWQLGLTRSNYWGKKKQLKVMAFKNFFSSFN